MKETLPPRCGRSFAPLTLLVAGLLLGCAAALAVAPPTAAAGAAPPKVKIDYVKYTLPNGLDVILSEDHRLPIVGVNIWYHVGPANEEPGRTGFAHLFEHFMFKGSGHIPDGMHWKYLQGAGATLVNATTDFDRTNYIEDLASNQLELALWLESDRMGFLLDDLDQYKLSNQQDVVRNERRQTTENQEYGLAEEELFHQLFPKGHPYFANVIGSHEDIQAAKLEDVRQFFQRYYCPNNASLAIVGDIDIPRTKALVEKYFGTIPRGAEVPPIRATTPPITSERRATVTDNISLSRVYMGWITPAAFRSGEADGAVAAVILGGSLPLPWSRDGGKSNRLYKKLIYEMQIAQDVVAKQDPEQLGSIFQISATAKPGHTAQELAQAIDAELKRLATEGPTKAEVEAAQRTLYAGTVSSLERVGFFNGIADRLNRYNYYVKDPGYLEQDLKRYAAVTPESVKRFVAQYLTKDSRVVVDAVPGEKVLPPSPPTPPTPERTAEPVESRETWRQNPPEPAPAPPLGLPTPKRFALANGLTVYLVEDHHLPLATASLTFRAGSASDPPDLPGLAGFTAVMLEEGTETENSLAIADRLQSLGATLWNRSGVDDGSLGVQCLSGQARDAIGMLADVALHPAFPEREIERVRQNRLTELTQERDSPPETAGRIFQNCLYGPTHPYGHPALGTEAALHKISREDMLRYYRVSYTPGNAALVIVGDVRESDARKLAQDLFGGWQGEAPKQPAVPAGAAGGPRIVIVDKPGSPQTRLVIGQLALPRNDSGFDRLSLLNSVMGGGFTGRINMNLREAHGYTYGMYSNLTENRGPGCIIASAGVRTDVTGAAISEVLKEVQGMIDRPVTEEELTRAKGSRVSGLPGRFQTEGSVAYQVAELFTFGLPDDYYRTLPSRLQAISAPDLAAAAREYLTPKQMTIVAVGDRAKIAPQMESLGLGPISYRDPDGNALDPEAAPAAN
jgi:zinc protease